MAKMIPAFLAVDAPDSERRVFSKLAGLGDGWTVLHSVKWQAPRAGRQGDGEADFLLLHCRYGIIVLEVKGGGIAIKDGQWTSTDRHGDTFQVKNPFDQAVASKYALIRYIADAIPLARNVRIGHAVVLPDVKIEHPIAPYAKPAITVDRHRLANIQRAIAGVVKHWELNSDFPSSMMDRLVAKLAPTLTIRPALRDAIADANQELVRLTAGQIRVLQGLRRNRRACVSGSAGTGKTILAIEKAAEFAAEGLSTLLTCYNALLNDCTASRLKEADHLTVQTFHGLCLTEMSAAGLPIPNTPSAEWWVAQSATSLLEALQSTGRRFDAIVVDEGQDFSSDWLTALNLALTDPDESPMYVFLDSHQDLYTRQFSYPKSWPQFELDVNCRNTRNIAERVAAIYGDAIATLHDVNGPPSLVREVSGRNDCASAIQDCVANLVSKERLEPTQFLVITDSQALVERLRAMLVGSLSFGPFGGAGIAAETIWRCKGLESDVVVLALTEDRRAESAEARALAYVGLSRPRTALYVFGTKRWLRKLQIACS